MEASASTPYDILGVKQTDRSSNFSKAYRIRIREYRKDRLRTSGNRKITAEQFRLICRAYETLSDHDKRNKFDQNGEWIRNLPLENYTLQQLAACINDVFFKSLSVLQLTNAQDPQTGHTTLYCAARACNLEAVLYLIEQGTEPDLAQRTGSTALHVSAFYGHPEIVRCLLECGADYRKKNSDNSTAENESYDADVIKIFTDLKKTSFIQAAANQLDWFKDNINNMTQHIDEQYYVQRQTLLHCASKKGYLDLVRWLIEERSANLDIIDINLNSALHLAAYGGHKLVVEYLLKQGANLLLLNKWCLTAEQEGLIHGKSITNLFQSMREKNMFEMSANGIEWWFEYYFGGKSPNIMNDNGINLLYIACRHGQTSVAKWLLERGANVNIKLLQESESTPLHGAVYHGHISTVDLLLSYGADLNIKNVFGATPIDESRTDEMKQYLKRYRTNLEENKFFSIHLYSDGKKTGDEPLAKLQLNCDATYNDLINAMPDSIRNKYPNFSIARRPLNFDKNDTTILSAICRARYDRTKFVQLPLCITAHEKARYTHSGHILRDELPNYSMRDIYRKFASKCRTSSMKIRGQLNDNQTFTFENLSFTFPPNCANENLSIVIDYIISPDFNLFNLLQCICLFKTKYQDGSTKLNDMPTVLFTSEPNALLYNWIQPSAYWFSYRTRQTRLVSIGQTHAFVRHIDIIPSLLCLPPDMFISTADGKPFEIRSEPISCYYLKIREHNKKDFPHIAYHGTSIKAIESILMDGLVMPRN
ncbi:unnamed protein product [Rotaria sordida]|uniref:J domain-containing protein n=1 Tax=Rotaria sordida TaxID=392033 RepID=A0A814GCL2_9BILA|nr:unnamed protein product [Rotaria sordida]